MYPKVIRSLLLVAIVLTSLPFLGLWQAGQLWTFAPKGKGAVGALVLVVLVLALLLIWAPRKPGAVMASTAGAGTALVMVATVLEMDSIVLISSLRGAVLLLYLVAVWAGVEAASQQAREARSRL